MAFSRRTVRFDDQEWENGHHKANAYGETLADVLRRLLSGYLLSDAQALDGYKIEYRATPKSSDATLAVDGITGSYEQIRQLYPAKHWHLEERTVSDYRPVTRKAL